jgi:hypothetical protein
MEDRGPYINNTTGLPHFPDGHPAHKAWADFMFMLKDYCVERNIDSVSAANLMANSIGYIVGKQYRNDPTGAAAHLARFTQVIVGKAELTAKEEPTEH